MILNGLSEASIFLGSLFLREIFLIPSVAGIAGTGTTYSFGAVLGAGILGLIINDILWFLGIQWDPRKVANFVKEEQENRHWLSWPARTWFGLLLVSSVLVGSRLLVFWQMMRRKVGVVSAIGAIVAADVIWGVMVIGMSWAFGRKFLVLFEAYRPMALVALVGVVVILIGRRVIKSR